MSFQSKKTHLFLASIGFAGALPLPLLGSVLSLRLKEAGWDLISIGWLSLLHLPFALKPFFAPVLESTSPPFWRGDRREGWLFLSLLATCITLIGLGLSPQQGGWVIALSFSSAFLYLAGLQVEIILARATGQIAASASVVSGYRIGLLLAGGGTLILSESIGWEWAYMVMGSLLLLPLFFKEPLPPLVDTSSSPSFIRPLKDLASKGLPLFVFLFFYRLGDDLADPMLRPYFLELGFSKLEIANFSKGVGMAATLLGAAAAGMIKKIPYPLVCFGLFHAVSLFLFSFLEHHPLSLAACVALEHFSGGLVITAFIATLWKKISPTYATTQYASLWALLSLKKTIIASFSGVAASYLGWPLFFGLSAFLSLIGALFAFPIDAYHYSFSRRGSPT